MQRIKSVGRTQAPASQNALQPECWSRPPASPPFCELTFQLLGRKEGRKPQRRWGDSWKCSNHWTPHTTCPLSPACPRAPCVSSALATALDVGLSNWSFLYITVSL